jgi:polyferredoxin
VLKKRSRLLVTLLSLFSLAYFGFYREGCVCSIGAIQNVAMGLFTNGYSVPLVVVLFFLLPLLFTLLFGRTFCAAVCPFGALQDLVAFKPLRMGPWLNAMLGMIPFLYLALSVLLAATATDFIICRYDPFVGIFRLNASFGMLVFAGVLLLSGVFIARPYCRFLCPYGVLLNWMSRFSWKHMTITPGECIQCRLCEHSCPYDAIDHPQVGVDPAGTRGRARLLAAMILVLPVLVALGVVAGDSVHKGLAGVNRTVALERLIRLNDARLLTPEPPEITAYRSSGIPYGQVVAEAESVTARFKTGSRIAGGFIGLVFGVTLLTLLRTRYHSDYHPNRGRCFSCAKCTEFCPVPAGRT